MCLLPSAILVLVRSIGIVGSGSGSGFAIGFVSAWGPDFFVYYDYSAY